MRTSLLITYLVIAFLLIPSTRRIIMRPFFILMAVLGLISLSVRDGSRNNRGL